MVRCTKDTRMNIYRQNELNISYTSISKFRSYTLIHGLISNRTTKLPRLFVKCVSYIKTYPEIFRVTLFIPKYKTIT